MTTTKTAGKLAAILAILVLGLTGCTAQSIDMTKVTAVIDVRTAAEYAGGHLQGAINIDVESGDFTNQIETLDKAGNYVLYCHSGRRAGLAFDAMKNDGFTGELTNAGGIGDAASATKLSIVTN